MTFHFKIQLQHISKPPVWRKVAVPAQFNFLKFHEVIQAAFGWENYHLFEFSAGGFGGDFRISMPDPMGWDEEGELKEAKKIKLSDVFKEEGEKYTYTYDFGDSWEHLITLEKIADEKTIKADCLAGKGACPPEDCGGPWGYAELKETLADPKHPEHEEMKEWAGLEEDEEWDSAAFDLEEAQAMVRLV
jgi:hypothetical protein